MPEFLDDHTRAADLAPDVRGGTAVVVGNFDGVHRGHQALFGKAVALARDRGVLPVALTFDPHPAVVLGRAAPDLLTTLARRVELLAALGAAHVFVRRFDKTLAGWAPERFVEELVLRELFAKVVVCGQNFRFGKDRAGDGQTLRAEGARFGFEAFTEEVVDETGVLSSTRVRAAILGGDLALAERILGRPHAVEGVVVRGDGRGRTLGFPTANVASEVLAPNDGVYAVAVDRVIGGRASPLGGGVMNVGVRPTVASEGKRTVEVHVFGCAEDLYGTTLRAHVLGKLRDERRFASLDALKAQIADDAREAQRTIASRQAMNKDRAP